ncbi:hypothetical protein D3227_02490 [Mesorhizobium waimense]|uniref:Uncharacterized protein n=1 Tax=Mesorhizobium waimense TaxID=1300307 RepID=A0A3A5L060_9HYPH|nr:hypothetical protein [Mesorhizobium waimense]RJT42730.1 hypothetical protein D3227_02490 [Mesorhizobium waimense]
MVSRKKFRPYDKWQKNLADSTDHDIINDLIFLLIRDAFDSAAAGPSIGRACLKISVRAGTPGEDFDGKSFPVLPQGQDLHGRR